MKNNDIKKPLNSNSTIYQDVDKRILPFFSVPVILKKIRDQKENRSFRIFNPQKKLIYKIIKLNEKLVEFTTSIKKYNLNLDSFLLLPQISDKLDQRRMSKIYQDKILDLNVRNKSDFILFTRNNPYYNLKFRLSNIFYKIEKFIPVLKLNSLLKNIFLFVPKRLLKPHPNIGFTYRIMQINNNFNFKNTSYLLRRQEKMQSSPTTQSTHTSLNLNGGLASDGVKLAAQASLASPAQLAGGVVNGVAINLIKNYNLILPVTKNSYLEESLNSDQSSILASGTSLASEEVHPYIIKNRVKGNWAHELNLKNSTVVVKTLNYNEESSLSSSSEASQARSRGGNDLNDYSIIQLHKFDNGRSIKYILLELNNLLNEIENLINIKNLLIKSIKIERIKKLITLSKSSKDSNSNNTNLTNGFNGIATASNTNNRGLNSPVIRQLWAAHKNIAISNLSIAEESDSNQSVKNLRLKFKKINSKNHKIETEIDPFLVENGMVKENIIKIEKSINSILPTLPENNTSAGQGTKAWNISPSLHSAKALAQEAAIAQQGKIYRASTYSKAQQLRLKDSAFRDDLRLNIISNNITKFDAKKDIINENSNPVDLLYFNNNLKNPVINQYLKSMSTYNMITNGTILYYSNIIGFNFKKKIRAYLPFFKSVFIYNKGMEINTEKNLHIKSGERLTSPYPLRDISKVVGSLDKGKFSIFGRGIENNKLINNIYKLLHLSFKSMYCLISKPVFINKSNKIIIQLFYFVLIPKIFKHMKSKNKDKPRNKKRIYWNFLVRRKKQALATLYQTRFKEKEDALKVKYFVTLRNGINTHEGLEGNVDLNGNPTNYNYAFKKGSNEAVVGKGQGKFKGALDLNVGALPTTSVGAKELINSSNSSIMKIDNNYTKNLLLTYKKELIEMRKIEENISGVKFDKFGLVTFKSLENKIREIGLLYTLAKLVSLPFKFFNKLNRGRIRIPVSATSTSTSISTSISTSTTDTLHKGGKTASVWLKKNKNRNKIKKRFYRMLFKKFEFNNINNNLQIFKIPIYKKGKAKKSKLFKALAKTYLNIFKFKVRHPLLNNIKLRWFKKELIKDKSDLVYFDTFRDKRMNITNNRINWFLFQKLFWNIRLSKKIIPNPKIMHKLGIPQWRWMYSSFNNINYNKNYKKGYAILQKEEVVTNITPTIPLVSYSWPFSLLNSPHPTFLQLNKRINNSTTDNDKFTSIAHMIHADNLRTEGGVANAPTTVKQNLVNSSAIDLSSAALLTHAAPATQELFVGSKEITPILQKRNRYKIGELYTKRYHLMKLANINLIKIYPLKFEKLCEVLNSIFNKPVELDLIRLHYPYNDSNILVRLFAFVINKVKLRRITRRLFHKVVVKSIKKIDNKDQVNIIPAFLSGITIKVAGRLMKYRVVPRKTVKFVQRGSSSIGKVNYLDTSRYTNKNKRGSFSITIKAGQNFSN